MMELDSSAVSSRRNRAAGSEANGKGGSSLATSRFSLSLSLSHSLLAPSLSPRILYPYACARSAATTGLLFRLACSSSRVVKNSRLRATGYTIGTREYTEKSRQLRIRKIWTRDMPLLGTATRERTDRQMRERSHEAVCRETYNEMTSKTRERAINIYTNCDRSSRRGRNGKRDNGSNSPIWKSDVHVRERSIHGHAFQVESVIDARRAGHAAQSPPGTWGNCLIWAAARERSV